MNMVNETVFHRQFGSGTITDQTMTRITVEFCEEHGIKKFSYPYAFENYLELSNPVMKQNVQDDLRKIHQREESDRQQHAEEEVRRLETGRQLLLEQKRTAAKVKSSAKKSKASVPKEKGKD